MAEPYICPIGTRLVRDEPCPVCGASEDTEEGCLGGIKRLELIVEASSTDIQGNARSDK